jgi:hypothetical protein
VWSRSGEGGNVKQLARFTFTLSAVLSMLVFTAAVLLGMRSYRVQYLLSWWGKPDVGDPTLMREHNRKVLVGDGDFAFIHVISVIHYAERDRMIPHQTELVVMRDERMVLRNDRVRDYWIIKFLNTKRSGAWAMNVVAVPWWSLAAVSAILPAWWYLRHRRRRLVRQRVAAGLCVRCGYDLRESPERCPECGAVPSPVSS